MGRLGRLTVSHCQKSAKAGKRYVLTVAEAITGLLETYHVPHATARNTILGLEKQVLW